MILKKQHDIITLAVFKDKYSSKHWIEIGSSGGLEKRSDGNKELVQLVCCSVASAKLEIKHLKKKYGIEFFGVKHKN